MRFPAFCLTSILSTFSHSASADPIRFIAIGDLGDSSQYQRLQQAVNMACQTLYCDYVLTLGDNFYKTRHDPGSSDGVRSPDDKRFQQREDLFRSLNIPVYWILGNHDYGSSGSWKPEHDCAALSQVSHKQHRLWNLPARYYARRLGKSLPEHQCSWLEGFAGRQAMNFQFSSANISALMLALDSTPLAQFSPQHRSARSGAAFYALNQGEWINTTISSNRDTDWIIAIAHHPVAQNVKYKSSMVFYHDFIKQHICEKVHLFISGHAHSLEWLKEHDCGATELFVSGAGSQPARSIRKNHPAHFATAGHLGFLHFELSRNQGYVRLVTSQPEFIDIKTWSFIKPGL